MTDIQFDLSGFQEMIDTLDSMGKEGEKLFKKALDEGAKPVLEAMKRKAPIYSGPPKKGITPGLLRDNIKVGQVRKNKDGVFSQVVGPGKGDISKVFYGKFSEYGTSSEPAKPWMRPAFDESQGEAYNIIENTLQEGIEQAFNKK